MEVWQLHHTIVSAKCQAKGGYILPKYIHPVQSRMKARGYTIADMIVMLREKGLDVSESTISGAFSGKRRGQKAMDAIDKIRNYMDYLDGLENRKEV